VRPQTLMDQPQKKPIRLAYLAGSMVQPVIIGRGIKDVAVNYSVKLIR